MKSSFLLIATFLLLSCGSKKSTPVTSDTTKTDTSKTNTEVVVKDEVLCFELKEIFTDKSGKKDITTSIQITMKGNDITGTYGEERLINGGNVDGANGDLKGTRVGDTLKLDLTYTIEGYTQTDEAIYLLQGDKLMEKQGEMIQKGDKFVIKNPAKATFSKTYSKVNCQ